MDTITGKFFNGIVVRSRLLLLTTILFLMPFLSGSGQEAAGNKNILILFAYSPGRPAYRYILEGIREKLSARYRDAYILHTEYLEMDKYPTVSFADKGFAWINEKYRNQKPDLLVCVGVNVIPAIKKLANPVLLNCPALSIDYDFSNYGVPFDLVLNKRTTVIGLRFNIEKEISTALALFPEARSIYFVCGKLTLDSIFLSITKKVAGKLRPDVKTEFITELPMDEILGKVRHLPTGCIVFVPSFNTDSKGVPYFNTEAVRLISQATVSPVFTYSTMGLGDGAVGGYLLDFNRVGILSGDAAVKILDGVDPATIRYGERDYSGYLFDWRVLERFNLTRNSQLPAGSSLLFREETFFQRNIGILIIAGLFVLVETILIFNLILLYRRQKKITARLKATENKFRELVREDRILRIGQLTASLSHELNQPMTAILSTAQAGIRFIDSGRQDPALLREILQNIAEDDKRMANLLASIRSMMKLEKREKEIINLNELIRELLRIYGGEAVTRHDRIHLDLTDDPVYVLADPIQIQQVILNLLQNGSQAMEVKKQEERKMVITESVSDGMVTISLRDYGTGIPEEILARIFNPFVTSRKEGIGIGLSISRSIIEDHGGKIWARNMTEGGAEFSFSLKQVHHESGDTQDHYH